MQTTCPKCGRTIPSQDVNVATDVAFCRGCNETYALSSLVGAGTSANRGSDAASAIVSLDAPPKGAWCIATPNGYELGATTRSPIAFFLVPFMLVWSGGSLGGIYGTQIASGHFSPFMSLFGIPFLLGSILFWAIALMAIAGKVTVTIDREGGEVFTGLGPLGRRKRFLLSEISEVNEVEAPYGRYNNHYGNGGIALEGKRRIRFGGGISEERKYFLVHALRQVIDQMR